MKLQTAAPDCVTLLCPRRPVAASVKIDAVTSIAFGRQFDHTYALYSRVTRTSIDALKEFFREELSKEDIDLLVKQKKQYGVI